MAKGRIITFAETTEALLAGAKTVTRREWSERYARSFRDGEVLQAWDKNPRTRRGMRVGTVRLVGAPYIEPASAIPNADWAGEGFAYMVAHGLTLFGGKQPGDVFWDWRESDPVHGPMLWVVRFELSEALTVEEWRAARIERGLDRPVA